MTRHKVSPGVNTGIACTESRREACRTARSHLAALQVGLPPFSTLSYAQILLALDAAFDFQVPAAEPVRRSDREAHYLAARRELEVLADTDPGRGDADRLALELVITELDEVWTDDARTDGLGRLP